MLLLSLLGGAEAHALEYCADSSALLQFALAFGLAQASPYTIKIVQGNYSLDAAPDATTDYFLSAPTTIAGGYTAGCASRVLDAANTTIDFGGHTTEVNFKQGAASPAALLAFDGLTLKHGGRLNIQAGTWGQFSDDTGNARLTNLRITDFSNPNTSTTSRDFPLQVQSYSAQTILENVQIDHIVQLNGATSCAVMLHLDEDSQAIVGNSTIDLAASKKLCFGTYFSSGDYVADVYNSIVWGSDGGTPTIATLDDFDVMDSFAIHVVSSVFNEPVSGVAAVEIVSPLHGNPQWLDPAAGDYHLSAASAAVNSGTPVPPGGLPTTDIEGGARWIGGLPDRGAYESPFNNATSYVVTSTADSGPGSLRDAITQANTLSNPATISFAMPGACPRVIALATVLPTITSPVIIDGTTQPGSTTNTSEHTFNANLCVIVKPASGTLVRGFAVPSSADAGSLTLHGIGLGGFGQPVMLLGGSNHVIAGNQFGGTAGGISLPGASLYALTLGVNASGSLIVGGINPADRNVIGGAGFGGISVQSTVDSTPDRCQIANNLIGLAPNGASALPNFTGINIAGNGCSVTGNRIAGNTKDAIWITGGNGNVVQRNILGVSVAGIGFLSGAGVRISAGTGNIVGSSPTGGISGTLLSNTIRYMLEGGVVLEGGSDNSVRSNLIYDNGLSGEGMDIDLDVDGATANDLDDGDDGANHRQNFPLIEHLYLVRGSAADVPAVVDARLNALPGAYRIDAYFSNRCDNGTGQPAGRGHAEAYVGTVAIEVGAGDEAAFSMPIVLPTVSDTAVVSLTATDALGNTSEIGSCYPVADAESDAIFADSFETADGP